ncbi:MAG: GtrA family protein [Oscillospiraceae bacterium]|jgi:putative flippase GtrA|nr:GtrA family protein [Oscillospiraceae bacterium]
MKSIWGIIRRIDKKIDLKKFVKFALTGVLNTAIDFSVYTLCLEIFKLDVKIAQPAGQCVAIINSYLVNKNWTFQRRKNYNIAEMLKFLLVNGGSVGINVLGVFVLHDIFGVGEYLCKLPIAAITIVINYFGNRLFVFRENKESGRGEFCDKIDKDK